MNISTLLSTSSWSQTCHVIQNSFSFWAITSDVSVWWRPHFLYQVLQTRSAVFIWPKHPLLLHLRQSGKELSSASIDFNTNLHAVLLLIGLLPPFAQTDKQKVYNSRQYRIFSYKWTGFTWVWFVFDATCTDWICIQPYPIIWVISFNYSPSPVHLHCPFLIFPGFLSWQNKLILYSCVMNQLCSCKYFTIGCQSVWAQMNWSSFFSVFHNTKWNLITFEYRFIHYWRSSLILITESSNNYLKILEYMTVPL